METPHIAPRFQKVKHFTKDLTLSFPPVTNEKLVRSALTYKAEPDDIFICTYPKCGTTWMQNIVWLITRKGKPIPPDKKLRDVSPCLEFYGREFVSSIERPRVIKTHFPLAFAPQSKEAKYIYVARNPKDSLVSYYFHVKGFAEGYKCPDVTLDGLFEAYLKGEVEFNNYFDHVGEWYQKRNEPNVLFLLYEDLKKDPETNILKIARFLGEDYEKSFLAEDKKILKRVLDLSSIKEMKSRLSLWVEFPRSVDYPFVRKGEIGDWKNHLTEEQGLLVDQWIKEKGAPYGVDKLWSNHPEV